MAKYMFGRRKADGKIVSIKDYEALSKEEQDCVRGLQCKCICPKCGVPLEARLGEVREKHFAHEKSPSDEWKQRDCSPEGANETALHELCKEIFCDNKYFTRPAYCVDIREVISENILDKMDGDAVFSDYIALPEKTLECMNVVAEETIGDIRPDIVVDTADGCYLVEFFVTHGVDKTKKDKVEKIGLPMLEYKISLDEYSDLSRAAVTERLSAHEAVHWIFHPDKKRFLDAAKTHFMSNPKIKKAIEAEAKRKRAQEKYAALRKSPSDYAAELRALRGKGALKEAVSDMRFFKENALSVENIPFYLDIPIDFEMIFGCDRRIWQSYIFNRYVYNRVQKDNVAIPIDRLFETLADEISALNIDWDLAHKFYSDYDEEDVHLPYRVIREYLYRLAYIGFIRIDSSKWAKVLRIKTLKPGDTKRSKWLEEAISQIDFQKGLVKPQIDSYLNKQFCAEKEALEELRQRKEQEILALEEQHQREEEERVRRENEAAAAAKEQERQAIMEADFSLQEPLYDTDGYSWHKCDICGGIMREEKMSFYSANGRNGICCDCGHGRGNRAK